MRPGLVRAILVLTAASLVAGCGAGDTRQRDAFVAAVDVTYSTQGVRQSYLPDLDAVTRRAATARAPFYADAFDGSPTAHIRWRVQSDFSRKPPAVYDGNDDLERQYLAGRARALHPALRGLLATRPTKSGSPLGQVLETLAGVCGQQREAGRHCHAYVFTDGVFIGDGFDARHSSQRSIERFTNRWAKRLDGLRGADVSFVGVGYGTSVPTGALDASRQLSGAVLEAAGARLKDWNVRLAPADAQS